SISLDTYIRGTPGVCQPFRLAEERGERYETCCPKLTVAERTCGPGPERPMRGKNPANSRIQLTVSKRPTLTFFFPAAYTSSTRRRLTEYEIQVQDLQAYIRSLEAETVHLRKKLEDAPKDFMILENKLREANRQLVQAFNQNEKLVNALYEAREQITALKEE